MVGARRVPYARNPYEVMPFPVLLRIAPVSGETTWSLLRRVAAAYGMHPEQVLGHFAVTGSRPRHEGGTVRSDGELVLNGADGGCSPG